MTSELKITPTPWATDYTGNIWGDTENPDHDGDSPLLFCPHNKNDELHSSFVVQACNGWNDKEALRSRLAELET